MIAVPFGILLFELIKEPIFPFFALLFTIIGACAIYYGARKCRDKELKLLISPTRGVWTTRCGFVPWRDIRKADVIDKGDNESSCLYLQLFLFKTNLVDQKILDELFYIDDLAGKEIIETLTESHLNFR